MPDCSAIQTRLDEAIAARDRLMTGSQVVVIVDAFRTRVEYRAADIASLNAYIQQLQAELNSCLAAVSGTPVRPLTKPINFIF